MMKNDYRRALILLRAVQPGLNGHVRLERRTLMGSMQFTVSGLGADSRPLQAAMAARTQSGWKIVHIGTLGRDSRGQAGLNWTFDPRAIEGLPLEKYSVFLVLQTGESCRTLLTGYVNGAVQVDWERVEQATCQSYSAAQQPQEEREEAIQEQAAPEEAAPRAEENSAGEEPAPQALEEPGQSGGMTSACPCIETEETPAGDRLNRSCACEAEPGGMQSALDAPAQGRALPNMPAQTGEEALEVPAMARALDSLATAAAQSYADALDVPARAVKTAMDELGLRPDARWPEGIEPLRETFVREKPFAMPAQQEYVFVQTDHAPECPQCAVGVRAQGGRPVAVAYAIPGQYAPAPPAGLEGYVWRDGWWIAEADAQTGEYLHI